MHVDDMAAACIHIMQNVSADRLYGELGTSHINIGVGHDISIADLAGIVKAVTGYTGEIVFDRSRPDGTPRKLMDVSLLKSLGFAPSILLEEGIRQVYRDYCK
jgi:GDP-L-fucose synthase